MADHPLPQRLGHLAEGGIAWTAFWILRALPLDWASDACGWLARRIGPRLGISRRAARNIRRAMPELDEAEVARIVAGMWENLGRTAGEYPHLADFSAEGPDARIDFVGQENLNLLRDDGIGGIIFSGHLANWELGSLCSRKAGMPLVHIYRSANNPIVERLFRYARRPVGGRHYPKGNRGALNLVAALKKGEHLGLLVDQKLNDGIAVPFFGQDAMTAPALAEFALRFDVPVLPARTIRLKGATFRQEVLPPLEIVRTGDRATDVFAIMRQINALIEGWVREHPEQWLWLHRRWPD
ncbi:MAG: lauroyl acyltransferase [Rhodospirillaceae bacterium]|nr:lauroyl acyltransferase [Rhodospirillaceae bacterium]|tara:strand:+ start:241 stop:1131 length:891 start_codon:yes stop_codon:yes gene_type:complete